MPRLRGEVCDRKTPLGVQRERRLGAVVQEAQLCEPAKPRMLHTIVDQKRDYHVHQVSPHFQMSLAPENAVSGHHPYAVCQAVQAISQIIVIIIFKP